MESHRSSSLMPPLPLLFLEICVRCNLQRRLLDSYESLLPTTRESFRPLTEGRPSFPICADRRQLMRRTRALEKGHILRFAGRLLLPLHCLTLTLPDIRSAAAGTWRESGRFDLSPELFAVSQHVAFILQRSTSHVFTYSNLMRFGLA